MVASRRGDPPANRAGYPSRNKTPTSIDSSPAFPHYLLGLLYCRKMPGFDFTNHTRNAALHAMGMPLPKATSTGTTIVGCKFDGGVVIAAG